MSKLPDNFFIDSFPQDGGLWRLEALGPLDRNPAVESEPLVSVALAPYRHPHVDLRTVNAKSAYEYGKLRIARTGAGLLPILFPGTFWRDGRQAVTPPYTRRVVSAISFRGGRVRRVTLSEAPRQLSIELHPPFAAFPEASYLLVDPSEPSTLGQSREPPLIVPSVEIARFYYLTSTQLTREILTGGLDHTPNRVYDPEKGSGPNEAGACHVHLRRSIRDTDAPIVARIAFDEAADRAARNIHAWIIRNFDTCGRYVVDAVPPFDDTTTWHVHGKWIKPARVWHFLVYWIESCSAPFPRSRGFPIRARASIVESGARMRNRRGQSKRCSGRFRRRLRTSRFAMR
jgi:hypothetical protein